MSVGYPNLRVRLIGFLPGLTTPGGVTHQAVDDVALMRLIPNMTVVDCGDSTEVESVLDATEKVDGPVYVRMLRGDVPRLFPADEPLHLGEPRILSRGLDIAIFSSGICTEEALRACTALRNSGVSVSHAHVATLKPFPAAQLLAMIASASSGVITMENHFTTGGLGSAVAEIMAENAVHVPLVRLGLRDVYAHGASKQYLMRKYGMDAIALVRAAETILGKQISVNPLDLASMPLDPVHSLSKPEAL
jgi:transketolase